MKLYTPQPFEAECHEHVERIASKFPHTWRRFTLGIKGEEETLRLMLEHAFRAGVRTAGGER